METNVKEIQRDNVRYKAVEYKGMTWVNLTPHEIVLNSGERFPVSGVVAHVDNKFGASDDMGVMEIYYGDLHNVPSHEFLGVTFIVPDMVLEACRGRGDMVAPATCHPGCARDDKGGVVSVPGFVRYPGARYREHVSLATDKEMGYTDFEVLMRFARQCSDEEAKKLWEMMVDGGTYAWLSICDVDTAALAYLEEDGDKRLPESWSMHRVDMRDAIGMVFRLLNDGRGNEIYVRRLDLRLLEERDADVEGVVDRMLGLEYVKAQLGKIDGEDKRAVVGDIDDVELDEDYLLAILP